MKLDIVSVSVSYNKGGMNYFNGGRIPRGIYLRFAETTVERTPYGRSESFMIGGSRNHGWGSRSKSFLLEELPRGNPKRLAAWAEKLDPVIDLAASAFRQDLENDVKLIVYTNTLQQKAAS